MNKKSKYSYKKKLESQFPQDMIVLEQNLFFLIQKEFKSNRYCLQSKKQVTINGQHFKAFTAFGRIRNLNLISEQRSLKWTSSIKKKAFRRCRRP